MKNQSDRENQEISELKEEIAMFVKNSLFSPFCKLVTRIILGKYNYGSTYEAIGEDAQQFAVKELLKKIENGSFKIEPEIKNRNAYIMTYLKNHVRSFLHERLERSSYRKTKAELQREEAKAEDGEKISKFATGYRFNSINTRQGRRIVQKLSVDFAEHETFNAEELLRSKGLKEHEVDLIMMRLEGRTFGEIGEAIGKSEDAARMAFNKLAHLLDLDKKALK